LAYSENWVIEEAKAASFGDARLNRRYKSILSSLCGSPNKSISASCKSWSETLAAYRFLNHDNVNSKQILSPHVESTLERIKGK
jgi:hypothetical protein